MDVPLSLIQVLKGIYVFINYPVYPPGKVVFTHWFIILCDKKLSSLQRLGTHGADETVWVINLTQGLQTQYVY